MKRLMRLFGIEPKKQRAAKKARRLVLEQFEKREVMAGTADLVAYRPVTNHIDFTRYPIPEAVETDVRRGVGIRINGDDDNFNGIADRLDKTPSIVKDNDLVRVDVRSGAAVNILTWKGDLAVWTSQEKSASIRNGQMVVPGQTIWVEYVGLNHIQDAGTQMNLVSIDVSSGIPKTSNDSLVFHTFQSEVIAIGGFTQDPAGLKGVFAIATGLYQQGYDVHMFRDSDALSGAIQNEVASAVLHRKVASLAMVGMSYGGGALHNTALAIQRNPFISNRVNLQYTAYIDAVQHLSLPPRAETRYPRGSKYHDNIFQKTDVSLFAPHGDYVLGANNINVTSRGSRLNHGTIDGDPGVQQMILSNLQSKMVQR